MAYPSVFNQPSFKRTDYTSTSGYMGTSKPTTPATSTMGSGAAYLAGAGAISGVASAISSIYAGKVQSIGYQMQAAARRSQAGQAVSAAKLTSLKLKERYNEVASSQAVMFAAKGKSFSGGSVQNIMRVDQEKLQWDLDYTELAGEAGTSAALADAEGFETSASLARQGATTRGLFTLANTAIDYAKVK